MNSITNYHYNDLKFQLSRRFQYDFKLANDVDVHESQVGNNLFLDLTGDVTKLYNNVSWDGVASVNLSLPSYGLTAIDNGAVPLLGTIEETLTSSPLTLTETDNTFEMFPVEGYKTPELNWDISITDGIIDFQGGFFQGFYKLDGYDYQTLPERHDKGWTIHTKINRDASYDIPDTLNTFFTDETYDTQGFFIYFGTRAENKFWNTFDGDNVDDNGITEKTYEGVTEVVYEKEGVEETAQEFIIPLNPPRVFIKKMDNQFLIYGRSSGNSSCGNNPTFDFGTKRADSFRQGGSLYYMTTAEVKDLGELNPFLKYGRGSGKPSCRTTDDSDPHVDMVLSDGTEVDFGTASASDDASKYDESTELDVNADVIDNACGFRITPDGKFGYRRIIPNPDCEAEEKYIIEEKYSDKLTLDADTWYDISLVWVADKLLDECDGEPRNGKLMIYSGGYLVDVFRDFREIIAKPLEDHKNKQIGVPYNISLGGGTLGLFQSMTFEGPDPTDAGLLLEKNFAGTFIGSMDGFKMYNTPFNWCDIQNLIT
jgi:hypothetical protein